MEKALNMIDLYLQLSVLCHKENKVTNRNKNADRTSKSSASHTLSETHNEEKGKKERRSHTTSSIIHDHLIEIMDELLHLASLRSRSLYVNCLRNEVATTLARALTANFNSLISLLTSSINKIMKSTRAAFFISSV